MTNSNDDLRALIDAAAGATNNPKPTSGRPTASPTVPSDARPGHDIRSLVQQASGIAGKPVAPPGLRSTGNRQRLLAFAVVLALLLAAGGWFAQPPALSGAPASLHKLAQAVEQYRLSRNGSLPEQLSKLEQFPKDAVEWQLKHWKARDAAGRTEILWAPNGPKHYRIVLRQGNEVWVYSDMDGKSKQTKP